MTVWQKIRLWIAVVAQSAGWLFVVWAVAAVLKTYLNGTQEMDVLDILIGLANGFIFLIAGALLMLSVKQCLRETTFLLLTLPAFATCTILVSFYLYAFGTF